MATGEPYGRVKEKARYMMSQLYRQAYEETGLESGVELLNDVVTKLIESAPQQTLQALCDVMDDDATT